MDNPAMIGVLLVNITRVIGQMPLNMLERIIKSFNLRMDHFNRSYGQHLKEIIFKNNHEWLFCMTIKIIKLNRFLSLFFMFDKRKL